MGVRYDPGGGGGVDVTSYSESFLRADQPFWAGDNWWVELDATCNNAPTTLTQAINCSVGGGLTLGNTAIAAQLPFAKFIPANVNFPSCKVQSANRFEFAEMKLIGNLAGTTVLGGPGVLATPNNAQCYWLAINSATLAVNVNRGLNAASVNLGLAFNASLNDTCRLEGKFSAAGNILKSYQNGILRSTITDTAGLGPVNGGIHFIAYFGSAQGFLSFANYSGGLV